MIYIIIPAVVIGILYLFPLLPPIAKKIIENNNNRSKVKVKDVTVNNSLEDFIVFEVEIDNQSNIEQKVVLIHPNIKSTKDFVGASSDGFLCNEKLSNYNIINSLNHTGITQGVNLKKGLNKCMFIYKNHRISFLNKPYLFKLQLSFYEMGPWDAHFFNLISKDICDELIFEKMFE